MIKAKTYPDFKEFVKDFVANVKAGKRYDFRAYQEAVLPLTYSSPWPESDIPEVTDFNYTPDYTVPFSEELLYSVGAQMRTADFFMDLQYAIINGKDVDTVYCEWLARVKPFSMLNAKLKDSAQPPVITTQPTGGAVNEGSAINLSIVATNATSYQWKKGSSDISGATSATYTKAGAVPADAGSYTCVATNAVGSTTSGAAVITINPLPVITTQPTSKAVNENSTLTLSVVATGATSYQWKKNGTNISGATSATYSKANAKTTDAGSYTCVVTNAVGSVTSNAATVTINPLPVITAQPQDQDLTVGQTLTISITATGATGYQWRKGNSNISGATSATYTKASVTTADDGNYDCVVTNAVGSVTSHQAKVQVTA